MPLRAVIVCTLLLSAWSAQGGRRALLIGINDYTASRIAARPGAPAPERDWPNLSGAVNDVHALREMLVLLYGFDQRDIVTLTDQSATRVEILRSLHQHLVVPASSDDVLLFYFAGHGSQVRNTRSTEPDQLDESLVPADSRRGAPDVRDKELRILFNRILKVGARLTIVFDSCHSGSAARGLASGAVPRGIDADLRDIADAGPDGPKPETRGALVLSASQDFDQAWEMRGEDRQMHGAFSWALLHVLRDAADDEPAEETFLRARARVRAAKPFQEPVMAGNAAVRLAPLFGTRAMSRDSRAAIIVDRVLSDGTVILNGGWAHGLNVGTELRHGNARLTVTTIHGLGRSEARLIAPGAIESGTKLEVVRWAPPPTRPLRVWMPHGDAGIEIARALRADARRRGLRWIDDPTEVTPDLLLRHDGREWQYVGSKRRVRGASLFVQFPAPALDVGDEGIEIVQRPEDADYILAGRYTNKRLEYAWIRPSMKAGDARMIALPVRTRWTTSRSVLREAVRRLRTIHAWQQLESPPRSPSPFQLVLRRDGTPVADGTLLAGRRYTVGLRAALPSSQPRYVYVFVIDSHGKSILVFPDAGSVENRMSAPRDLATIAIQPPYGLDTWFLLTTGEPLDNPWLLEWEGVRTGRLLPPEWSIEKMVFESRARD